ncbi:MAG: mycothiol synthase [Actinomycetota bacterium]|jgi:ribosomal protein S18 acetylase RimI-like enzyme|nr:mycothiol synthase [Actinomycetota bacterium]
MDFALPDGYDIAPMTDSSDLKVAGELVIACDIEVSGYSEFTVDDMRSLARLPRVDLTKDSWIVRAGGEAVAATLLWDSEPNLVFKSFGVVRVDHQGLGLGNLLMERVEARARERAEEGAVLRTFIDINEPQAARLAEIRGFHFVRRSWSMLVEFDELPAGPVIPEGITIRAGGNIDRDLPLVHALVTETFAGHWGFSPRTFDEFAGLFRDREDTDPTMWFFAHEDNEPVAVLVGQLAGDTGWVADLGVRKAWRKRGLGEALLRTAFQMFYERGFRKVGLGVDTGNETGAVRLYERVGMKPERGDDEYEKALT